MSTATQPSDARQHILDTAQHLMSRRGFTAVGLTELLAAAEIPKGSFYYYFRSKDAFGKELLESYFSSYLAQLDTILTARSGSAAERLMAYWENWRQTQGCNGADGKCLAVKLGAEVSDLSEAMRSVLQWGMGAIVDRLAKGIEEGMTDGSLAAQASPHDIARTLYHLWLGASLAAKIGKDDTPLASALAATRQLLKMTSPGF